MLSGMCQCGGMRLTPSQRLYRKRRRQLKRYRKQLRLLLRTERQAAEQHDKEQRLYVRWLLFCKGRGKSKNLNTKDAKKVTEEVHRSYDRYMMAYLHGIDTRVGCKPINRNYPYPPHFMTYRRIWYGRAKACYIHLDVPKLMKMRWQELQYAKSNTAVPQQPPGEWMLKLQREISERDPRELGLSVSNLPGTFYSLEGWHPRPQPFRPRRKKTPGGSGAPAPVAA